MEQCRARRALSRRTCAGPQSCPHGCAGGAVPGECATRTTRRGSMAGRGTGPDFVEALARGLDVLTVFDERHPQMSLTEIAAAADLARPTARRLLLTLQELGRSEEHTS